MYPSPDIKKAMERAYTHKTMQEEAKKDVVITKHGVPLSMHCKHCQCEFNVPVVACRHDLIKYRINWYSKAKYYSQYSYECPECCHRVFIDIGKEG